MRSIQLAVCLIAGCFVSFTTLADDRAPEKTATAFWQRPNVKLDMSSLRPAATTLTAVPNDTQKFALLQTTDETPNDNFVPTNPTVAPLVVQEDSGYSVLAGGLKEGALPYRDRKYKIQELDAAFSGLTLLQTKAGHKAIVDGRFSIVLDSTKPCHVFVAIDQRALDTYKQHGTPTWLEEFAPTGKTIATDDPIMAQTKATYLVFVRSVPAGLIALGSPGLDLRHNSMYFAFFAEAK